MKEKNIHINFSKIDAQSKKLFAGGKFVWKKSGEDVWKELENSITKNPLVRNRLNKIIISSWAIAAGIALLLGMVGFIRFYSKSINTETGSHLLIQLPDKSTINLNAQSSVKYNPYWWNFSRKVKFEGEGLFEVVRGKKFEVFSKLGTTQVVGTRFNIFSREEAYRVTCLTGSVKVTSKTSDEVILKPDSKAAVQPDGKIDVIHNIETLPEISWKNNIFLFTASPVREVFKEIERQYGVTILFSIDNFVLYTGNFNKDQNVEDILSYICPAIGYKFIRKTNRVYYIIPNDE